MAAIQTLKTLRDQVLAWLDETGDTGTTYTNITNALNQAHQQRVLMEAWPFMLWNVAETFTTVAGQLDYSLHLEFARPLYFRNLTSTELLIETPFRGIDTALPTVTDTRTASEFYLGGRECVSAQPTGTLGQTLLIASSSASDTGGSASLQIRGVDDSGFVISETLVATGLTAVSSENVFTKVLNVSKIGTWVGSMTLSATMDGGGFLHSTVLSLGPTEYARSYPRLSLLHLPTAGDIIEYKFFRQPSVLVNDYDIPDIPPPFAQILVWDALLMFAGYNSDIGSAAVNVWRDNQTKLEVQMQRAFQDAQSLGSGPRSVRYIGDDVRAPRFIS